MTQVTVENYQIKSGGLKEGYSIDQVADLLSILFKRPKKEIKLLLSSKNGTIKKGINLANAMQYKEALEKRGCLCSIEVDLSPPRQHKTRPHAAATLDNPSDFLLNNETLHSNFITHSQSFDLTLPLLTEADTILLEIPSTDSTEPAVTSEKSAIAEKKLPEKIDSTTIRNEIGTTVKGEAFIIKTPQEFCCNCGGKSDITTIETDYVKRLIFSTRYEQEQRITLALPYCPVCRQNVGKYPISSAYKWLIAVVIWFGSVVLCLNLINLPQQDPVLKLLVLVLTFIPSGLFLRWLDKPKAPQTSTYFPLKIKEYSRNPNSSRSEGSAMILISLIAAVLGKLVTTVARYDAETIPRLSMRFSNSTYASAFKKENSRFIRKGYIRLR